MSNEYIANYGFGLRHVFYSTEVDKLLCRLFTALQMNDVREVCC